MKINVRTWLYNLTRPYGVNSDKWTPMKQCNLKTCQLDIPDYATYCCYCGQWQEDGAVYPELHTEPIPKVDITARDTVLMPAPLLSARTVALRRQARERQKVGKR